MARLSMGSCPKCGAEVSLGTTGEYVDCGYCGSRAFVQRSAAAPPPNVPVIVVSSYSSLVLALAIGLIAVMVAGGAVLVLLLGRDADEPAVALAPVLSPPMGLPVTTASEAVVPAETPPEPTPTELRVVSSPPVVFQDLDGDGYLDVVAAVEISEAGDSSTHYAVLDGRTGALRARTPALALERGTMAAVTGGRLVLADNRGQLTGYDLVSGDLQWTTALGERVASLCEGGGAGELLVATAADRTIAVDRTTGRQGESRASCERVLVAGERLDPRDRRDVQAPFGVEAYVCGGVTVMGSNNFRVPDACRARFRVDTDRLEGMVGHRLWRHGRGHLVFGVRVPGTYVPMVGRLERGRFAWKSEVPDSNPLEAQEGGPPYAALAGDSLVVAYSTGRPRVWRLTAFALEDGARRWTVPMPGGGQGLEALAAGEEAILVHAGRAISVLSPADGSVQRTLGGPLP